ncbi:TIGR01620 family protein [Cognatishimia sp. SS12]|uniref:YcjF family protein n=1 Tax=Cognatishimia sp. SS12 TaxID=2979465 RepID=UPI002330E9C7|nr:TIGR01620 family protein [Cognatishimia sp. SS12]MDC0738231.1 TIGR01620 family protein [Cognatishimia sp. SS12]
MSDTGRKKPVLITLEDAAQPDVAAAPSPPEDDPLPPQGQAMQQIAQIAAKPPSRLARWFWGLLAALLTTVISLMAWQFATDLLARYPLLGMGVSALLAAFVLVSLLIAAKEMIAFGRLRRVDALQRAADQALADDSVEGARRVARDLAALYKGREEMRWGADRMAERLDDSFDAIAVLAAAEQELLAPLDAAAKREVEAAARQVATVTALVPLALADVAAALVANLRMIRRIAEIYSGRSGTLGSWRLTRAVMAHLVATGAVAVGDDLIGSLAGGSLLGKVSRRFGEGLVNGALTARVGVAAMEVCRPMAFSAEQRPSVSRLVKRALTGLFGS